MEEKEQKREQGIEKVILIIYSLYTVAMVGLSVLSGWDQWIPMLVSTGMVLSWAIHLEKYRNYQFRAFFISVMCLMNFTIYGIYAESFFGLLSTMGALAILLGIFNIPQILYLMAASSIFLLCYHGFIARTIHFSTDPVETPRILLQIISMFIIEYLTYSLVRTQAEMRETLMETIETLKKAEHSKDDFMANVSHEIRTPINTVCGMSEMILQEDISPQVRENVFDIQAAGRNLLLVVSDILDFSELESGKMDLAEEPYNITSTINDVINMSLARKQEKNIEIIVDCDASIPSGLIGDEQKVRRIMMNLMDNAIKFTKEGCITLSVSARREEYGVNLCVKVRDTGIGMNEAGLEKLFTTFNQVDTRKNRQEGGIGLGLAISQAVVQKMGGFITVESVQDKGSEFQFVIPQKVLNETPIVSVKNPKEVCIVSYINMEKYEFAEVRDSYSHSLRHAAKQLGITFVQCRNLGELKRRIEKGKYSHVFISWEEYCEDRKYFEDLSLKWNVILVKDRDNREEVGGRMLCVHKPFYALSIAAVLNGEYTFQNLEDSYRQGGSFTAPDARVLVVDDNIMNLKVVEGLLRPYQIKVFAAGSGKEALKKIETMDYDFVFMDHMMPQMDGVETLHRIRQKPGRYFQNVPIIALTANAIGGVREMFLSEGFQDFVAKPIEMSVLERVLRRYIPENKMVRTDISKAVYEQKVTDSVTAEQPTPIKGNLPKDNVPKADLPKDILQIEGIDVERGIEYCGGELEDYLEIAEVYYNSGLEKQKEIEQYYQNEDWENYSIMVHALKSTSLGIGAVHLSELAGRLEQAAGEGKSNDIRGNHREMMTEYERVLSVLKENERICPQKTQENLQEIEQGKLEERLEELTEQLETLESDRVEEILEELFEYQYQGQPLKELFLPVQEKVNEFDFMGAEEMLTAVKEKMR